MNSFIGLNVLIVIIVLGLLSFPFPFLDFEHPGLETGYKVGCGEHLVLEAYFGLDTYLNLLPYSFIDLELLLPCSYLVLEYKPVPFLC